MTDPAYRQLAGDLRRAIERGDYPEGAVLPKQTDLAQQYGIAKQTVREAVALLEAEGLVDVVRRRGTVVRAQPARHRIARGRHVHRDDRGYSFDSTAHSWTALEPPTITWAPAPKDIAAILGVPANQDVLVRDRLMGDPANRAPMQLATSYLPASVARGTRLAEPDTGPGGIYDRLEEEGDLLNWDETVSARMPTPDEATRLALPAGVPLLRIVRTAQRAGTIVEVNDTRMSAAQFEIGYTITRHHSAQRDPGTAHG
jgi:GntR family transcriptional regulator